MEFEAIISDIRIRNCAVKLAWLLRAEISLEIRRVGCPVTSVQGGANTDT